MSEFFIGDTNFGVEVEKSRFDLGQAGNGRALLTIEVHGNKNTYNQVKAAAAWAWTLYPPYFYLRDYPVSKNTHDNAYHIQLKPWDVQTFDVGVYLMEHYPVAGITITLHARRVAVSGQVKVMGKARDLRIHWEAEG